MKVELRATDSVKPYEKNPRVNDAAVDAVARSLERFGFRQPVVVDKAGVIKTRWKASRRGGTDLPLPCHRGRLCDLEPREPLCLL